MLLDCITSELFWKFFNITFSLLWILWFRILSLHIRDIADSPIRVLTIPKLVEIYCLTFEKILRIYFFLITIRITRRLKHDLCNYLSWIIISAPWPCACFFIRLRWYFICKFSLLLYKFELFFYLFLSFNQIKLLQILKSFLIKLYNEIT